ncbi:MAG: glycosyl transferase family 9 [Sphingomonas bacterium]|nr:glycosyltransferase family 9 protein [Sphingomonas bacterium]MDB5688126.1 glycosyl transferase family 9 [Sphingomonas bacterium]
MTKFNALKQLTRLAPKFRIARDMIRRANTARDGGRFAEAALLYAESLRLRPGNSAIHVQSGHMFKEAGDRERAEEHYEAALALTPDDPELALQLGHFHKTFGRLAEAREAYQRAARLAPSWDEPRIELGRMGSSAQPSGAEEAEIAAIAALDTSAPHRDLAGELLQAAAPDRLIRDLLPRPHRELMHGHAEEFSIRRLGRLERTHWGAMDTLRGVEAIRGFYISSTPIAEIQISCNDQLLHRGPPRGGYVLPYEGEDRNRRKYVFNVWHDFSGFLPGRYQIRLRATDAGHRVHTRDLDVVIAPPLREEDAPRSDGFVPAPAADGGSIEEQINSRPSMIRPGRRAMIDRPVRTVLVQRADQLGDMVVSVPAIRRLREILPDAKLVGMLSAANAGLAETLGLFDAIIIADLPDDRVERRRIMTAEAQEQLVRALAPYTFDMAIDLTEGPSTRPLLLLSGAPITCGFRDGKTPLTIDIVGNTHDPMDNHEVVPHTNKLLGLVEWIGAMLRSDTNVARREDLDRGRLAAFGIGPDERFAVLHDGARLRFSRWPHYAALAARMLRDTDLKIVLMTDDAEATAAAREEFAGNPRFRLVTGLMPFDDFDALLSFCAVFVGNDSGPKHLASLRGAPVVSLHMARNNWNEWGQENGGYIISRKVPCTGCLIHYDAEECGKDFVCMTNISVDEVFGAAEKLLQTAR